MAAYLPFAAGGLGALCCIFLAWGFHLATAEQQIVGGIPQATKNGNEEEIFILVRITEMIGRPFTGLVLGILGPRGQAKVRRRLARADRAGVLTVERYAQRKAGDIILYCGLGVLMLTISTLIALLAVTYGLFITDMQLWSQAQKRQEQIQKMLPDFLDVLAVTVSAGLGFRHALARVAETMPGAVSEEFQTALQQMELGASRREAFEDLRSRNNSESLGQFVTALLQAEELGAPLAQALSEISIDMRRNYAQWARRHAQKVNPRITLITLATILPALLMLIVGAMFLGGQVDFGAILGR